MSQVILDGGTTTELKKINRKVNVLLVITILSWAGSIIFAIVALSLINTMSEYSQCWSWMYMR